MSKPSVLGIGELLWDLLPEGKRMGGAPANFAYHARRLGCQAALASAVGDDALGRELLESLRDADLDPALVQVRMGMPTGTVGVELDAAGKPSYTIHDDVAWDAVTAEPGLLDAARRANAVCFGSLGQRHGVTRAAVRAVCEAAAASAISVFDINLRPPFTDRAIIETSLEMASVLKINDEELPWLAEAVGMEQRVVGVRKGDPAAIDEMLAALLDTFSLELVALTRGAAGSLLYTDDERDDFPGLPVIAIRDTVGAGDAFTAALTVGLLHRRPLAQINRLANHLAAYVCGQHGAMPPYTPELDAAMAPLIEG